MPKQNAGLAAITADWQIIKCQHEMNLEHIEISRIKKGRYDDLPFYIILVFLLRLIDATGVS